MEPRFAGRRHLPDGRQVSYMSELTLDISNVKGLIKEVLKCQNSCYSAKMPGARS